MYFVYAFCQGFVVGKRFVVKEVVILKNGGELNDTLHLYVSDAIAFPDET